jgi:tetratricopeptide (TPR) repeat protein
MWSFDTVRLCRLADGLVQAFPRAAMSNGLAVRELNVRALFGKILSRAYTSSRRTLSPSSPSAMRSIVVALLVAPRLVAHAQCSPSVQKLITDTRYDEARAEVESLIKKNGSDDAALHCMGRVYYARGESGKAVDWFEKAVKSNGKSALHHLWLGNALGDEAQKANKLRQPLLARRVKAEFESAVALDPTLVDARGGLVQFYAIAPGFMGGDRNKATEQIAEITKLNPMRGHMQSAWLAQRDKDLVAEEREYIAATQAFPDSTIALNQLANFYRRQKKWAQATTTYEHILRVKPDAIGAHLSIGGVAAQSGEDLERGEREIKQWLSGAPKDAPMGNYYAAHYWLGMIYAAQGKKDLARSEYESALAVNPKGEDARKALAALK